HGERGFDLRVGACLRDGGPVPGDRHREPLLPCLQLPEDRGGGVPLCKRHVPAHRLQPPLEGGELRFPRRELLPASSPAPPAGGRFGWRRPRLGEEGGQAPAGGGARANRVAASPVTVLWAQHRASEFWYSRSRSTTSCASPPGRGEQAPLALAAHGQVAP